jgi:1-acyl-sn-glycerol-3-phosphate acyltransferase
VTITAPAARTGQVEIHPWLRAAPCAPETCVRAPAAPAGVARRVARLAAAALVLVAGVPVALLTRRVGRARRVAVTSRWARLLLLALGVRISAGGAAKPGDPHEVGPVEGAAAVRPVEGAAVPRPAAAEGDVLAGTLLVANHVSWLDPLVMAAAVPSRPLAKREVGEWPLVRTLVSGSGVLFIDRQRLSALPSAVAAVADALSAGDAVVAFPEGTTWCGHGMGEFRPAVFQAAIDAGAAVRPVRLRYHEQPSARPSADPQPGPVSTRACYVGDDSLLSSLLRVVATRHLAVEVTVLAPVRHAPTARRQEARAALARQAEAGIRGAAVSVSGGMPGHPVEGRPPGRGPLTSAAC